MLEGIGRHDPTAFTGVVGCWDMDAVSTTPLSGVTLPDPDVWWRYDGDGSTVTDYGTLGLTGTVVNGPVPVSADGYTFDGVNQYVNAAWPGTPSTSKITLAAVCTAASFSLNEAESPPRKMPIALGLSNSTAPSSWRGIGITFTRTNTSPELARVRFTTTNDSTQIDAETEDDQCSLNVKMCVIGSANLDSGTDLQRVLYADENGVVRFYTAYQSFTNIVYETSPQLDTGRHRQSNINDRYWQGTIKEAQVYDGVALDFRQMLQLAQNLLGVEFALPHFPDTSGNGRHLYAEQPEQFGEILTTSLAPGYQGAAINGGSSGATGTGYHTLWYPDPQSDFRLMGTMAVGCVAVCGDLQSTNRSTTTSRLISCGGDNNNTNVAAKNELWGMALVNDILSVSCYHESGTGTDRNVSDAAQALTPGLLAHVWMSRTGGTAYRRWLNGIMSPGSPMTSAASPDRGEQSCLRIGCKEPGYGSIRGAIASVILISGTADDADAITAYEQTVGLMV